MKLYLNGQLAQPALGRVTLQKSRSEAAASLTATLYTAAADTYFSRFSLAVGNVVRLLADSGEELFLGTICDLTRSAQTVTLTAYDPGIFLARNELYGVFRGSSDAVIRAAAAQLGLTVGTLEPVPGVHSIVTSAGQSAFSLLRQAAGAGREIRLSGGVLSVLKQSPLRHSIAPEQILQCSSRVSIGQMVNKCIVTNHKAQALSTAVSQEDLAAYGQFQAVLLRQGSAAAQQAKDALRGKSFCADVTLLGNSAFHCSDTVVFAPNDWGLEGAYAVTAAAHRWEGGLFTTELTLEGQRE